MAALLRCIHKNTKEAVCVKRFVIMLCVGMLVFALAGAQADTDTQELEAARTQLLGRWVCFTGGELLDAAIEFRADGTAQIYTYDDWRLAPEERTLIPYGAPMVYSLTIVSDIEEYGGVPYELELCKEEGTGLCYGLNIEEAFGCETLDVRRGEAGGGYCREGQTPVMDYGGWG